jgi:hypothetical protein
MFKSSNSNATLHIILNNKWTILNNDDNNQIKTSTFNVINNRYYYKNKTIAANSFILYSLIYDNITLEGFLYYSALLILIILMIAFFLIILLHYRKIRNVSTLTNLANRNDIDSIEHKLDYQDSDELAVKLLKCIRHSNNNKKICCKLLNKDGSKINKIINQDSFQMKQGNYYYVNESFYESIDNMKEINMDLNLKTSINNNSNNKKHNRKNSNENFVIIIENEFEDTLI